MFKDIKLTTINKLIASAVIFSCLVLTVGTLVIQKNILLIDDTWKLYQSDRSDKSRLESALRAEIGYGGMIHDFKNYILRNDPIYMETIHKDIGSAEAIINQYRLLELSNAELIALNDIQKVISAYEEVHVDIAHLFSMGYSITQLDNLVKIDDEPALKGLISLRKEVRTNLPDDTPLSKARVSADLRGAIGYGGMIHDYKNYILRHDEVYKKNTHLSLKSAYAAIDQYHTLKPNYSEIAALKNIKETLQDYEKNLEKITQLIEKDTSITQIDASVKIDDSLALQSLDIIDKSINEQIHNYNIAVSKALRLVKSTSDTVTWGLVIFFIIIFVFGMWLIQKRVMSPLLRLTNNMVKLSKNDLSITLEGEKNNNELGDIARAISVFRNNIIERNQAEAELAATNNELNKQLKNILELKEQSEKQTTQALELAEGLASARESAEKSAIEAEESEQRVSSILNSVQDAIITTNHEGLIESINPATEKIFGYTSAELMDKKISVLVPKAYKSPHDEYLLDFLKEDTSRDVSKPIEQNVKHKDGTTFDIELLINTISLSNEKKFIGVIKDITERKQWEKELKNLAMTDPLTKLANRNQYNNKLSEAAATSLRYQQPFALMLLDLDKFKPVNDRYGHQVGDLLLQHVANTLLASCRETDTVARLGGDEFAIILPSSNHPLDTGPLSQRILKEISKPIVIEEHSIHIGISIGISTFPDNTDDLEVLQTQADEALYQAKENGRNTFRCFKKD